MYTKKTSNKKWNKNEGKTTKIKNTMSELAALSIKVLAASAYFSWEIKNEICASFNKASLVKLYLIKLIKLLGKMYMN